MLRVSKRERAELVRRAENGLGRAHPVYTLRLIADLEELEERVANLSRSG